MPHYGLKLADGTEAVASGRTWELAAKDYVSAHGGAVIAWKQLPDLNPIVTFGSDPRAIEATCCDLRLLGGKRGC